MNKIILSIILAGFGTQLIKLIILYFKHKKLTGHDLLVTGGMPSSHAAFVTSLATSIYLAENNSTAFAISLVLAFIVIRDAMGVRRAVGEEEHILNQILKKLKIKTKIHYSMGHTPLQVLVGSILGIIIAALIYYLIN